MKYFQTEMLINCVNVKTFMKTVHNTYQTFNMDLAENYRMKTKGKETFYFIIP